MNNPLISVIIPVYNRELYIEECVISVINQTYSNLEILLIDDGSTDSSLKICTDLGKRDARVRVISADHGGVSAARNCGLKESRGEYIGFVDSDDRIAPEMYEQMLNAFNNADRIGIVTCVSSRFNTDGSPAGEFGWNLKEDRLVPYYKYGEMMVSGNICQCVTPKLYRSSIIRQIPFWIGRTNEDMMHSFCLIEVIERECWSVYEIAQPYYYYRNNDVSICNSVLSSYKSDICFNLYDFYQICLFQNRVSLLPPIKKILAENLYSAEDMLLQNKELKAKYYKDIHKIFCELDLYLHSKTWGFRHKIQYFIIRYIPYLWGIKAVREFCSKKGVIPPFNF